MICPHCNKEHRSNYHERAEINCENYGGSTFNFQCSHCKKIYSVFYQRVVKHDKPYPTDLPVSDVSFGLG